jgi:hypothetical protein
MRRDNNTVFAGNDNIGFIFDTFYDRRNSAFFTVNPLAGLARNCRDHADIAGGHGGWAGGAGGLEEPGIQAVDFAEVEADEQQVNLTRFSLFFPEKREFLLENQGTFAFGGASAGGQTAGAGDTPILFYSTSSWAWESRTHLQLLSGLVGGVEPQQRCPSERLTGTPLANRPRRRPDLDEFFTGPSVAIPRAPRCVRVKRSHSLPDSHVPRLLFLPDLPTGFRGERHRF